MVSLLSPLPICWIRPRSKITIDEAQQRIHSYYEQRTTRTEIENETKEADIVSARIAKLLGEKTFQFSPAEWITIHRRLFEGVFDHAGQIRKYNISKKEWILNGFSPVSPNFSPKSAKMPI